jgi:hypothetical protein
MITNFYLRIRVRYLGVQGNGVVTRIDVIAENPEVLIRPLELNCSIVADFERLRLMQIVIETRAMVAFPIPMP